MSKPNFESDDFIEQTHKNDGLPLSQRIFYTIDDNDGSLRSVRTAKLLSLLIEKLHQSDQLSDSEINQLLFDLL